MSAAGTPASKGGGANGGLTVTSEVQGDEGRIVLVGELDLACADDVERELRALEDEKLRRIVVDLGQLEFIDSSGLRTLIQAHSRARDEGRELVLIPGGESVQRVFELTRTVDVLNFEPRPAP